MFYIWHFFFVTFVGEWNQLESVPLGVARCFSFYARRSFDSALFHLFVSFCDDSLWNIIIATICTCIYPPISVKHKEWMTIAQHRADGFSFISFRSVKNKKRETDSTRSNRRHVDCDYWALWFPQRKNKYKTKHKQIVPSFHLDSLMTGLLSNSWSKNYHDNCYHQAIFDETKITFQRI